MMVQLLIVRTLCCLAVSYLSSVSSKSVKFDKKSEKRLPKALIIGVKKGGTRALLEYLRLHPAVRAPGPEVHFFDRHYDRGTEWYRTRMPSITADNLLIEKTPSYFVTREAPSRIFKMDPKMKLLVVVRDPVTRALSDYAQTRSKRPAMAAFEKLAFNETTGLVNTSWGAIKIGIYHRFLKRWTKFFPLSQIHFVSGENLISHPAQEMRLVENFLRLANFISIDHFQFNETKGFPCLLRPNSVAPKCLGKTKGRAHPILSAELTNRLRSFYLPHNEKFFRIIGRTFEW